MEFLRNHLMDIIEIIVSSIVGFIGGMKYSKVKNVAKIRGMSILEDLFLNNCSFEM